MADTDNATVALILQLLNEDGQTATADLFGKGKQAAGTETDAQMAMRLFLEEEVQGLGAFVTDRTMAISMQTAVCLDAEMCMMAEKQERMAAHDRGLSLSLGDHDGLGPQGDAPGTPATFDDDDLQQSIEKMACIYVNGLHEGGTGNMATFFDETGDDTHSTIGDQPESSKWAASRKRLERGDQRPSHKCNSCLESKSFAEVAAVPCRHEYCRDCLQQLFRHSMTDEAYFPPRCCKLAIRPGHQISLYLTGQLVREYERKAIEYSTPRRTYCHEPSCAAFIPPDKCSDTVATCTLCTRQTCTTCKQASHGGDCPSDGALQEVIQLARDRGWQRCGKCWSMVELEMGCNHMSCRCGFQFCYVCGAQWKTCRCEQWDERRLFERAVEIDARVHHRVDHAAGEVVDVLPEEPAIVDESEEEILPRTNPAMEELQVAPPTAPQIAEVPDVVRVQPIRRIAELMESLRINHECGHDRWRGRPGPRQCEECSHVMPQFIYECRQCHILACRRCRFHRL